MDDMTTEQAEQAERDRATLLAFVKGLTLADAAALVADLIAWEEVVIGDLGEEDERPAGHPSLLGLMALFTGV